MIIKRNIPKRINIDNYKKLNEFEYLLFSYLKKNSKNNDWTKIIIYTLKQEEDKLNYISNELIKKLKKIINFLIKNKIIIKFINFPFCILNNEDDIEYFFLNRGMGNPIWIKEKYELECLECSYYEKCLGKKGYYKNNNIFKSTNLILVKDYLNKINNFKLYLNYLGFKNSEFSIEGFNINELSYFLNNYVNKNIFNRTILVFYTKKYFLNLNHRKGKLSPNLFFKNYIIQKKLDNYFKNNGLSLPIIFEDNNMNDTINGIDYNDLNYYINLDISVFGRVKIGSVTKFKVNKNFTNNNIKKLKFIHISDINNINNNYDNYIVGLYNQEINLYIPKIYKFKYIISYSSDYFNNDVSHYIIISKEIGAIYIDNILTEFFFGLETGDLLEIDFNYGIIKRIG